ncbi:hypothetical protein BDV93DRAFT_604067, partial [Ceratobasidium sp. AG-I]
LPLAFKRCSRLKYRNQLSLSYANGTYERSSSPTSSAQRPRTPIFAHRWCIYPRSYASPATGTIGRRCYQPTHHYTRNWSSFTGAELSHGVSQWNSTPEPRRS